jgi:16S rRNA (guanine966-N2)-methyltransferase
MFPVESLLPPCQEYSLTHVPVKTFHSELFLSLMRIISGKYGGRVIHSPKGLPVRPTTDRTKEALFNLLSHRLDWEGLRVLDLFAGTGNISLECWSRGAREVVSVDQNGRCVGAIKGHLRDLGIEGGKVIRMEARRFLRQSDQPFDLVFMDPPYAMSGQEEIITQILDQPVLAEAGILIVEHAAQVSFDHLRGFTERRDYGSSQLSFFGGE